MDTFDGIHTFSEEDAQLVDSLLDDVSKGALTVNSSHLLLISRVQTDRFQVPTTGTGSRLPETGQCVLSSGSRF